MFELSAAFLIFILVLGTLGVPHQVGKIRERIKAGDASRTILLNILLAGAVYYVWWEDVHTQLRLIFAVILWALIAIQAILTVDNIEKPREVVTATRAAIVVAMQIVLLGMVIYLVAS